MEMNDMVLISTDDHLVEPAHLFERHIPPQFRDRAPRVVTTAKGEERWVIDGHMLGPVGMAAVAGRVKEELHLEADNYSQLRKGTYDIHARIEDMNANGVLASMCFSTMAGHAGEALFKGKDRKLIAAIIRAYNDWHIDEWCGAYPGRFIPLCFVPLWDSSLAVSEIRRVAQKGARAICLPERPTEFALPSFHQGGWDTIIQACIDNGIVIAIHIGTGGGFRFPSEDSPLDVAIATMNLTMADVAADLLFSPILRKFPDVRFALSEGYMGWIPFFKERVDYVYEMHRHWSNQDFGAVLPSELITRHFLCCFAEDYVGIENRHKIGIESITWECDYPHADSTWPRSPERLWPQVKNIPEAEIHMMTHQNAMRYFRFDPFDFIKRDAATVGALRALATHVDVEPKKGMGGVRPGSQGGRKPITARDVKSMSELMQLPPVE